MFSLQNKNQSRMTCIDELHEITIIRAIRDLHATFLIYSEKWIVAKRIHRKVHKVRKEA